MIEKAYKISEVCDLLRCTPESVRRWIKLGELKAYKITERGSYRINESEINTFKRKVKNHENKL